LPKPLDAVAAELGLEVDVLQAHLAPLRQVLYAARGRRKQPLLDTKILTSWNALMIRALAYAGLILQEPIYLEAAARCARFLLRHHGTPEGQLFRTSRDGVVKTHAFLDDYAFLIRAMISLHDAGSNEQWKDQAAALVAVMRLQFGDNQRGGFFFTDPSATDLLVRQKTASDSPLPSGNAVAALAHLELGQPEIAQQTLAVFAQQLADNAEGMSALLEVGVRYLQNHVPVRAAPGAGEPERPLSPAELAARAVSVTGAWTSQSELHLHLTIAENFHVNANPAAAGLTATRITLTGEDAAIEYPPGEERRFPFADHPIRVYEGQVTIIVRFKSPLLRQEPLRLTLAYQPCNDTACFGPVTQQLEIATP
jgi:uncharacterized protein YyaL (SSP411 family)